MKKLLFISALFALTALSACKQDWVCQCDVNGTVNNTAINGGTFTHAEHTCKSIGKNCSLITLERQ